MPRKSDPNYAELLYRERMREKKKREAQGKKPRRVGVCDQVCPYYGECKVNLWAVCQDEAGLLYVPLPCFAEHPQYDPKQWAMR
jgi:hypothetical protein